VDFFRYVRRFKMWLEYYSLLDACYFVTATYLSCYTVYKLLDTYLFKALAVTILVLNVQDICQLKI
jgi:hypothetical protein